MKKTLAIIGACGLTFGAFAQGLVQFDNNDVGIINVISGANTLPTRAVGESTANPGGGVWHVALLYDSTSGGGIAQNAFTEVADYIPNTANTPLDGAGSFQDTVSAGKAVNVTVTNPGKATFEVVSWIGSATTWFGANGASLLGGNVTFATQGANLVEFTATAADPNAQPPGTAQSIDLTGWNGNATLTITAVPEPSTYALGALGVSALLAFRRRK